MVFVLLLELFAVYLEEVTQLVAADGIIIQIYLLKKARTQWSFVLLFVLHPSPG
jgi:hypothetical protein